MEAPISSGPNFGRAVVRPVLAFLAASAAASLPLAVATVVGPFAFRRIGSLAEAGLGPTTLLLLVPVGWLYAFGVTALVAAAPSAVAASIGYAARAPRPWTEIAFGAVLGVVALTVLAASPLPDADALGPIGTTLLLGVLFAASGALGGWIYALAAGRRT